MSPEPWEGGGGGGGSEVGITAEGCMGWHGGVGKMDFAILSTALPAPVLSPSTKQGVTGVPWECHHESPAFPAGREDEVSFI